jgi:hypothetical protein
LWSSKQLSAKWFKNRDYLQKWNRSPHRMKIIYRNIFTYVVKKVSKFRLSDKKVSKAKEI